MDEIGTRSPFTGETLSGVTLENRTNLRVEVLDKDSLRTYITTVFTER